MVEAIDRARHVKETIVILREELRGRTIDDLVADRLGWAGYRYLLQTSARRPGISHLIGSLFTDPTSTGGRSGTSVTLFGMAITASTPSDFGQSTRTTSIRSKPPSTA